MGAASLVPFSRDDLPEADDMITVCSGFAGHLLDLAHAHRVLAGRAPISPTTSTSAMPRSSASCRTCSPGRPGCRSWAARSSLVSFGGAEVPTQGAQLARIAATAARVGVLIDRFVEAARAAFIGLPAVKLAADSVAITLERLDATRLLVAGMEGVPAARAARGASGLGWRQAELAATGRLAKTRATPLEMPPKLRRRVLGDNGYWASRRTLTDHVLRHARGVGARSVQDYVRRSTDLLQEALAGGFPTKVDGDGIIRVWDAGTGHFGVYRPDSTAHQLLSRDSCRLLRPPTGSSAMSTGFVCVVCGFNDLDAEPITESGGSYEICPSCGFQFGNDDFDGPHTYAQWHAK